MLSNSAILPASDFSGFYWQFSGAISGDKIRLLCADPCEYYLTSKSNIQRGTLKTANSAIYKRFFYFRTYQGGVYLHFRSDSRRFQSASRSISVYPLFYPLRTRNQPRQL
nr:MAG TPA: hypothetical protein [Caudoviricetes sp.]